MSLTPVDLQPIVWMDVETTGLDESDIPLEIAIAITDTNLNVMWSIESLLIDPASTDQESWDGFLAIDGYVRNMHSESGLIVDIMEEHPQPRNAVEARLCHFLMDYHIEEAPLAGNSVHFDRKVLQRWFPRFESMLHYRNIDVSSFKELFRRWYPLTMGELPKVPDDEKAHRSWPDLLASIEELKWYGKVFLPNRTDDELMSHLIGKLS